jgi:MoaA/NifB/PqqE/SkfB family radical SAM enzyme
VIGSGVLKFEDFRNFLEANPAVTQVELSNYGEVFLNPQLLEILRFAFERKVAVSMANGANLNHASREVLEALVKYQVTSITCSIDGASQETYAQYRVRGHFGRVLENIRQINFFKAEYASKLPRLDWQFIVFGHNEHEIAQAKRIAHELNMAIRFKLSWDAGYSPIRDVERVLHETGLPAASRQAYAKERGTEYLSSLCEQLWFQPQINWDGKNLGCCRNFWGDFGGNAFRDGLLQVVNNSTMTYAREMLQGRVPPRTDVPCTTCSVYQRMRATHRWMSVPGPLTDAS